MFRGMVKILEILLLVTAVAYAMTADILLAQIAARIISVDNGGR